jgi:hypothetical protein
MVGETAAAIGTCLILAVTGWIIQRRRRAAIDQIRLRLEQQGLTAERFAPGASNIVAMLNEQYGGSKGVSPRFYSVLVNDGGAVAKRVWRVENDRLMPVS